MQVRRFVTIVTSSGTTEQKLTVKNVHTITKKRAAVTVTVVDAYTPTFH